MKMKLPAHDPNLGMEFTLNDRIATFFPAAAKGTEVKRKVSMRNPAQYLGYPTAGVPKTPDGKPNLSAPAPRTADGKPDFSGMWGWETRPSCGARCGDTQISREFINIASTLQGGLPLQSWAAELMKQRSGEQVLDPNVHCMPRGAPRI
jgi:hypothetical protein